MKKVKIRESFKSGWELFMQRPWYLLGLTIAMCILFAVCSSNSAIATALAYIVYGGYLLMLINHFKGNRIVFDDLFSIDNRWISFAFLAVIKGGLILLGFLCFIIPGIYLAVRWMFAEYYVLDKGMRPLEALKASSELTKGYRWKLFLFVVAGALLVILGVFFLFIGAIVAALVVTFASIKIYTDLQQVESQQSGEIQM
jgi:O-antigen ligase